MIQKGPGVGVGGNLLNNLVKCFYMEGFAFNG